MYRTVYQPQPRSGEDAAIDREGNESPSWEVWTCRERCTAHFPNHRIIAVSLTSIENPTIVDEED